MDAIAEDSCYAKMRAADGRGPLFWAHEFYNQKIIDAIVAAGGDLKAKDKGGKTPAQMPRAPPMTFEAPPEPEDEYEADDDDDDEVRGNADADATIPNINLLDFSLLFLLFYSYGMHAYYWYITNQTYKFQNRKCMLALIGGRERVRRGPLRQVWRQGPLRDVIQNLRPAS